MVGTFYRAPHPGRRRSWRRATRLARADAVHPRGDEADEPREDRAGGIVRADPRRRTASRSSSASSSSSSSRVAAPARRVTDVQAGPGREPRRDGGARHPRAARARRRGGRRLLDGGRGRAARPDRRRAVRIGPPPAAESYLRIPSSIAAARDDRLRGGASGLRLPRREPRVRRGVRRQRPGLRRAAARRDGAHGRQGRARRPRCAPPDVPLVPGTEGATTLGEARARRGGARLSGAAQGGRRRRRQGDAPRRQPRRDRGGVRARRRAKRRRRSGTARSTSRRWSCRRATSRSRCSATRTAAC